MPALLLYLLFTVITCGTPAANHKGNDFPQGGAATPTGWPRWSGQKGQGDDGGGKRAGVERCLTP
jgi:hypothetical protein